MQENASLIDVAETLGKMVELGPLQEALDHPPLKAGDEVYLPEGKALGRLRLQPEDWGALFLNSEKR